MIESERSLGKKLISDHDCDFSFRPVSVIEASRNACCIILTFRFPAHFNTRTCVECHLQDQDDAESCDQRCSATTISINTTGGKGFPNLPVVTLLSFSFLV